MKLENIDKRALTAWHGNSHVAKAKANDKIQSFIDILPFVATCGLILQIHLAYNTAIFHDCAEMDFC